MLFRERAGLAFALAVPVLPLGNASAGLAWAYSALALAWLAFSWKRARTGLFFVAGPLLAPFGLLGLLPLAALRVRGSFARATQVFAAVLFAGLVAGIHGATLPFTGAAAPALDLEGTRRPLAAATEVWHALWVQPTLMFEAFVLAVAAAVLPKLSRRQIAPFGVALLLAMLLPNPAVPDTAIVVTVLATCLGLAVKAES
jgi:hypothetical protein